MSQAKASRLTQMTGYSIVYKALHFHVSSWKKQQDNSKIKVGTFINVVSVILGNSYLIQVHVLMDFEDGFDQLFHAVTKWSNVTIDN